MKTKHIIYALLFLIVLSVQKCQCKKDDPTPTPIPQPIPCDTCLPAITTTGQNTFGCRVNGKVWLPLDGYMEPGVYVDILGKQLIVEGNNSLINENIGILVKPISDTGYISFPTNLLTYSSASYFNKSMTKYYNIDTIQKGYIYFLRVDYINGVFSGTFAFDAYNNKNDTVHITDGRFDIHK